MASLNKRGIFSPTLFIFSLVVLVYAFSLFSGDTLHTFTQILGEKQATLTATYLAAEYDTFFIEETADVVALAALRTLASHGGMNQTCTAAETFTLWNSDTCTFSFNDISETFLSFFKPLFTSSLSRSFNLTAEDFTYSLTPYSNRFELAARASVPLTYTLPNFTYTLLPHFSRTIAFSFPAYATLHTEVLSHIECVKTTSYNSLTDTPETIAQTCGFSEPSRWQITKKGDVALFTVTPPSSSPFLSDLSFRFAIDLNRIDQLPIPP